MAEVINGFSIERNALDTSLVLPLIRELNRYHISKEDASALILEASFRIVGASAGTVILCDRHSNHLLTLANVGCAVLPRDFEEEVKSLMQQPTIREGSHVVRASSDSGDRYLGTLLLRPRVRIAIILVGTAAFAAFVRDNKDLLMSLAGITADTFERLEIEHEQEMLLSSFEALGSKLELTEIFECIELTVKRLFECDGVAIVERIEGAQSEPILRTLFDSNPEDIGIEIPHNKGGLSWWVSENNNHLLFKGERDKNNNYVIYSADIHGTPVKPVYRNWIIEKSLLTCPIDWGERTFGVISAYNVHKDSQFDNVLDPQLLRKIGIQAAIAIRNAEEFERAHSQKEQSDILSRVTELVSSTDNSERVIRGCLKSAVKLVRGDSGFIALRTLHDNQLTSDYVYNRDPNTVPIYDLEGGPDTSGIIGWVINCGKHYLTTDLQNDPKFIRQNKRINSKIAVPLQPPNEEILGVLSVDSEQNGAFNENQAVILQAVANQIALYIHKARFLSAVTLLANPFLRVESFDSLYDEALDRLVKMMDVQVASIHRIEDNTLVTKARTRGFQEGVPRVIPKADVLSWRALQAGRSVQIFDLREKPESLHHQEYIKKYKLVSAISVPIILGEKHLGVINVYARRPHLFSQLECQLLELLSETLAVNINNVELIREEEARREELEKAYKVMTSNNRLMAIYEMANSFVHDARNALNDVAGGFLVLKEACEAERKHISTKNQTAIEESVHVIGTELTNLSDYFEKLNNYARILETRMSENSINKVIELVLSLMQLRIKKNNIRVRRNLQSDTPFIFDRGQIEQVISNLVLNSIQAMEKRGGTLYVGTELVRRTIRGKENGCIRIRISDDGVGIKADDRQRIFDAFFTTKKGKGTGFGLTLCRKVVEENHLGLIDFESESGKGATFDVFLPFKTEEEDEA